MTRKGLPALAGLCASVMLVACGGTSNSATSAKSPTPSPSKQALISQVDACKLVTAGDAAAAAKTNMSNPAATGGYSIPGACVYQSADGMTTVFIFAQFYSDTSTVNNISPDQIAAVLRGQYGISNAKSVYGIGDKAFEYTATAASGSSSTGEAIFVFKSNVVLMIVLSPSTDSTAIETLARAAVNRLTSS